MDAINCRIVRTMVMINSCKFMRKPYPQSGCGIISKDVTVQGIIKDKGASEDRNNKLLSLFNCYI